MPELFKCTGKTREACLGDLRTVANAWIAEYAPANCTASARKAFYAGAMLRCETCTKATIGLKPDEVEDTAAIVSK